MSAIENEFAAEREALKALARREVQILRHEFRMDAPLPQTSKPVEPNSASRDSRKVWFVYGRNAAARTAMFQFMRAINLDPMEWSEATALAQVGAPYIGQVLDRAFSQVLDRAFSEVQADRQALTARLRAVGCSVVTETRTDWHSAGDFDAAVPKTDGHHEEDTNEKDLKSFLALQTPASDERSPLKRMDAPSWIGRGHAR